MRYLKNLEPKYSTLIHAVVITCLLVFISAIYDNEEQAAAQLQAVAVNQR
jgi:hypothetical protein